MLVPTHNLVFKMSENRTALLSKLATVVSALQQRYTNQARKLVYAKFDPMLFSENFQPTDFYLKEIQHTLDQLHQLQDDDVAQTAFFSEKLLAQCTALSDAIAKPNAQQPPSAVSFSPKLSAREQRRQEWEQLPPRERLDKYYEALKALNDKLNEQKDGLKQAQSDLEKARCAELIEQTRARRQRCLDAIEVLEEYLAFKAAQE